MGTSTQNILSPPLQQARIRRTLLAELFKQLSGVEDAKTGYRDAVEVTIPADKRVCVVLEREGDQVVVAWILRHDPRWIDRIRYPDRLLFDAAPELVDVINRDLIPACDSRPQQCITNLLYEPPAGDHLELAVAPQVQKARRRSGCGQCSSHDAVGIDDELQTAGLARQESAAGFLPLPNSARLMNRVVCQLSCLFLGQVGLGPGPLDDAQALTEGLFEDFGVPPACPSSADPDLPHQPFINRQCGLDLRHITIMPYSPIHVARTGKLRVVAANRTRRRGPARAPQGESSEG